MTRVDGIVHIAGVDENGDTRLLKLNDDGTIPGGGGASLSDADPQPTAPTAESGSGTSASRDDHVHNQANHAHDSNPGEGGELDYNVLANLPDLSNAGAPLSDDDPNPTGPTADAGTAGSSSRGDHVHPLFDHAHDTNPGEGGQIDYNVLVNLPVGVPTPDDPGDDGKVLTAGGGVTSWQESAGGGVLSSAVGIPSGDVAVTSANTWYDACSVSCVAGTWLLIAHINMFGGVAPTYVAKIYDATAPAPNTPVSEPAGSSAGTNCTIPLVAIVTPGVTTSYTLAGLCTASGATISKSNTIGSASGPSTQLIAVRIG